MKRLILASAVCLMLATPAFAVTQIQAAVNSVFQLFKFESVPAQKEGKPLIGGPSRFKVTKETIKALEKHLEDGDEIEIDGRGAISIIKVKQ